MTVNPIIGKKEWVEKPDYYDYYQEIARSSYMLICFMMRNDSVIACEVFHPVASCAKDVIKQNGFEDKIKVVLKHSTELTVGPDGDLKEKANILVAEVFDTELIGEGALRTFQHAVKFLLEPDCIVIPSAASVYAQIIESSLISSWNTLSPVHVAPGKIIVPPKKVTSCHGSAAVHDVQMSQIPQDKFTALTDPICVFKFSFTGEKSIEMNETFIKQVTAINSDKAQWRDHWMQAIYYLPDVVNVSAGDKITLTAYHDEYSLWFAIPKASNKKNN
ncbi:protein arginine N-methyltransferase 7 [Caerostris extrusa]|uniref:Protein arginine N-methyltransferase 7 n=1 Tax=Caerostris extrusa TaxID=172846 RepID=A0AAV4XJ77_CAEEX|nr:protein arginine N-methyltransferase 7 [Caerostris extrusa]